MTQPLPPASARVVHAAAVVIGGANIDQKAQTTARPVSGSSNPGRIRTSLGGVGRNVAENLARLGVNTALITAVGADAEGDRLMRETAATGVDLRYVVSTAHHTGSYAATLDETGELIIAVSDMDAMDELDGDVVYSRRAAMANARVLVLDCNVPEDGLLRAAELALEHRIMVVADPVSVSKSHRISAMLDAGLQLHTITPNLAELRELAGSAWSGEADLPAAAATLHAAGVQNVWVSLGANGSFLSSVAGSGQRVEMIAAYPATLVDATGAGDAMLAGYVMGLLEDLPPFAAARYGHAAAAITVESGSTVNPSLDLTALLRRAGHG